jgi:RHS repeat-associated protein
MLGYLSDSLVSELHRYHVGKRDYESVLARFDSQDPAGYTPDANPYRYVGNDPVNRVDPSGLAPQQSQDKEAPKFPPKRIQELVDDHHHLAFYYKGQDKRYVYIADVVGNEIRGLVLKQIKEDQYAEGVVYSTDIYYQLVFTTHIATLKDARGNDEDIGELLEIYRTRARANDMIEAALQDEKAGRTQELASAATFALHMIPFGAAADNLTQGNYWEASLSFAGDVAFFLSAGGSSVVKGARAARTIQLTAIGLEGGIAASRTAQGIFALNRGDSDAAAGYFGEAFLRLAGVGIGAITRAKQAKGLGSSAENAPKNVPATVKVYRKTSAAEAEQALSSQRLPPRVSGSNSNKYVSESLEKVQNFQNKGVAQGTQEVILEFEVDAANYAKLRASSIPQQWSAGSGKIVFNTEGLSGTELRNLGIPDSQLGSFNKIVITVKKTE